MVYDGSMDDDNSQNKLEKILSEAPPPIDDLAEGEELFQVDGKWYLEKDGVVIWIRWWDENHVYLAPIRDPRKLPRRL